MAEQADIQYVKDSIEREMAEGWDEAEIIRRLDEGANRNRVVESYWRKRATDFITLVNTSESGSTRGNDAIYNRMVAAADAHAKKADAEEATSGTASVETLGSFDIERA